MPPAEPHAPPAPPWALIAEVTHRCPLACPYCSNPLALQRAADELDTAAWLRVIDDAAALGVAQVHWTGGEPLVRRDLETLIAAATARGLYSHLVTGGTLADAGRLAALRAAGLAALQVSVQDAHAAGSDRIAGAPSFARKRRAVADALALGLHVTLNVVLHRRNLDHIERICALAGAWGVARLELAHTQWVGWAFLNRAALVPTREQVERAGQAVAEARRRYGSAIDIAYVCADLFQSTPKPCLGGWGRVFLTVAPDGTVLPCQAAAGMPGLACANVRAASLAAIWAHDPAFERFRGTGWMPEPCRSCPRRTIDFGGCRCQAWLLAGDPGLTDPVCALAPGHDRVRAMRERAIDDAPTVPRSPAGSTRPTSRTPAR